jgi:spermidine/putrescine transport system substrate-binding protein
LTLSFLHQIKELSALVGDVVQVQTALATGEVDIIAGGGEFAVSVLHKENLALDWVLPDQGGVRWQQAIGIFAASKKSEPIIAARDNTWKRIYP